LSLEEVAAAVLKVDRSYPSCPFIPSINAKIHGSRLEEQRISASAVLSRAPNEPDVDILIVLKELERSSEPTGLCEIELVFS